MGEQTKQKKSYRGWLIAFFAPCLLSGALGAWLGQGEFVESIGKNYSLFGKVPGQLDAFAMSSEFFVIIGLPSGLLGLGVYAIYRFLRRGSSATKH